MIVLACVAVIIVGHFRQICHMGVRLLQNWKTDRYIVSSLEIVSLLIFKVLFFDVSKELGVKGSKMAGHKGIRAI